MFDINKNRLIKTFTDLVKISSPSWHEENVINYIIKRLNELNITYKKYKCKNSHNLFITIKGNKEGKSILFSAHTDTVTPCENVIPVVTEKKISSDGTTILGSDDKAAVAMFIEALYHIKKTGMSHGPIEILFSCAEEAGLYGIKYFDLALVKSKFAFVFDSGGKVGKIILKAPFHTTMDITIRGKAAHAGIEPEKGINAINTIAEIITKLPSGRIDRETTMNIGVISGGSATNIVAENIFCKLEVRSISKEKLKKYESLIINTINQTVKKYEAKCKIKRNLEYSGFSIKEDDKIVEITKKALKKIKIKPEFHITGGGSDTNVINKTKIKAINLSCGMYNAHSTKEYIMIKDLINGTKLILSLIDTI